MKTKIREFSYEEDIEDVYRLYGTVFGKDSLKSWKKRWRWEYLESVGANYAETKMWVAEQEDGEIVGFQGSFPAWLKIGEKEISTYDPGDLAVYKKARRQGLGQALTKAYVDNEKYITMGYNYAAATGRIFCRLGFVPVYCVPIYYRLLDFHSIFFFLLDSGSVPPWIGKKPLVSLITFGCKAFNCALAALNHIRSPRRSSVYAIEELKESGPEFDNLWEEISSQFPIIFVRNAKFIKWRFFEDPSYKHTLLAARDKAGRLRGYIDIFVFKRKQMLVGRIMDLFCPTDDQELVDSLLAEAFEIFKQSRVAYITCQGLHPKLRKKVRYYLYIKPLKPEEPAFLNWKGESEMKSFLQNPENWHLSHADGDQSFFLEQ